MKYAKGSRLRNKDNIVGNFVMLFTALQNFEVPRCMYWDFDAEGKESLVNLELYNAISLCVQSRNNSNTEMVTIASFFQHVH